MRNDVSDESITSIFRIENQQSKKPAGDQAKVDEGDTFLQNVRSHKD
jgi:hypothetical protein